MSDVARIQEPPVSDLVLFAQEASEVHGIAKALSTTSFVPRSMQGKPDEITGAILAGREIGLSPMNALASIDIIEGRPSVRANTQRGLAMAAGCVFEITTANNSMVRMRAKAPGATQWTEVEWPIERARLMGLTNKTNWQKMPQAMLIARATSELCRLVAANVLLGMPYSTEELQDTEPELVVTPRPPRRAQRATVKAEAVAPDLEPEGRVYGGGEEPVRELAAGPTPEQRHVPEPDLRPPPDIGPPPDLSYKVSDTTRKAIMAGFNDLNIKERSVRLERVSAIVGRDVPSVNVLTEAEGCLVVRRIQELRQQIDAGGAQ